LKLVALDQKLEIVFQTVKTREESVNQARLRFEGFEIGDRCFGN